MKIDHIFHHLNPIGGAEEHITSLAELQKARYDDVSVCLIQATTAQNQYAKRLKVAKVNLGQWPVWLSRLSGDWDTREAILRRLISWLKPLIGVVAFLLTSVSGRPRDEAHASVEGRFRMTIGRLFDSNHEKRLFLLLLTWRYFRYRPDVLHLHSYGAGLEFVLEWAETRNLATVYQEHATPDLTKRRFYRLPTDLNTSTIVVAVSESSAKALRELCGVTRPIEVVPPIVASGMHNNTETKPPARQDDNVMQITTIARLSEEKGLNFLIQAAERVVATWPDIRFLIYGEGDLRESLEAQIEAGQLGQHVCLPGSFKRDELPGIMSTVDIFVLPSLTEGFPLSVVEAMAFGCPIVTTSVGGIPELIEDGVNGLLCRPGDPDDLAQKLCTLISQPALRLKLGRAARERYEHGPFQPESVCEQLASTYVRAVQNRSEWIWSESAYSDTRSKV